MYKFGIIVILHMVWSVTGYSQHTEEPIFADQVVEDPGIPKNDKPVTRRKVREGVFHLEQGGLHGMEVDGEVVIPLEYTRLQWDFDSCMEASQGGYSGIISSKNELIIPFVYSSASYNRTYHTVNVCKANPDNTKGCGIVSLDNKPVVPLIHTDHCKSIRFARHPNIAYACMDLNPVRTVFYDSAGVYISEHPYMFIHDELSNDYYAVIGRDPKYGHGILNSNFEAVVPATYTHFNWFYQNHACLTYLVEGKIHNRIIDLEDGSIKLDLDGLFKKPDETGMFRHQYYKDKVLTVDRLSINDIIEE
jgi:hypothetical protein